MKKRLLMIVLTLLICLTLLPSNVLAAPWFITFTTDLESEYEVPEGGNLTLLIEAKIGNNQNPVGWTYSYQWYKKVVLAIKFSEMKATGNSLTITSALKMYSAGQYYCKVTATHTDGTTVSENSTITTVKVVDGAAPPAISSPTSVSASWIVSKGTDLADYPCRVQASSPDGGALSYQWLQNTRNSYSGATAIADATASAYVPPTPAAGIYYYFCRVTNTVGLPANTASADSLIWKLKVNASGSIVSISQSGTYAIGAPVTLHCDAVCDDPGGTLSYQWQREIASNSWAAVSEENTYVVDTSAAGVHRFRCVVTAAANGASTVLGPAAPVVVTVAAPTLSVTAQPQDISVQAGAQALLQCQGAMSDGGAVSYQWYQTNAGGASSSPLSDQTSGSFNTPTGSAGTFYYICRVQSGGATAWSRVVRVTVAAAAAPPTTSAQSGAASVSQAENVPAENMGDPAASVSQAEDVPAENMGDPAASVSQAENVPAENMGDPAASVSQAEDVPAESAAGSGGRGWLWAAFGALLAAGAGVYFWKFRRKRPK